MTPRKACCVKRWQADPQPIYTTKDSRMNLLEEAWIPVLRQDGARDHVRPASLSDPNIVAFDAPRADFNGALAQFMIGLLQTCTPVNSIIAWRRLLQSPPDANTLADWFAPHAAAFTMDGDGARFMQDFDLRASDGDPVGIGALLIEAPGENTVKNNSDLFVKRGHVSRLCSHCAALALFTLQVNAPSGGAGHRTGLRGGGPLTTLLVASGDASAPRSLWQTLWLNVRHRGTFLAADAGEGREALHFTYPWMASISTLQQEGGQTTPVQVHPAHVFWAMPRRIRLDMGAGVAGTCDLCARASSALVERYVTRNYGLNYKGAWMHPLSPYYASKEGLLPLHPQPDGLGYRHWMAWVLGMQSEKRQVARAMVVEQFLSEDVESRSGIGLRLWAFGYDMDNMKARCWYDATVPLYALADCSPSAQIALRQEVGDWLQGAELVVSYLRGAVKDAWFSRDARGDFSFVDATFWSRTERAFYAQLQARIQGPTTLDRATTAQNWLHTLSQMALQLFDGEWVGSGPVERMNPARVAGAHRQLRASLNGPKLRVALQLEVAPKASKKSPVKPSKKA
jgi:CRISPR system Cascade subunit CasA